MNEVMTADEVAAYLHLNIRTVYRLARTGKIPARRVGGQWRFHRNAITEFLWPKGKYK